MTPLGRLERERRTFDAMIAIYCNGRHGTNVGDLCDSCTSLREYAHERLGRCRFGEHKPTCAKCPVPCYRPREREAVREVMRYAGPRMLARHPLLAVLHLLDGARRVGRTGD